MKALKLMALAGLLVSAVVTGCSDGEDTNADAAEIDSGVRSDGGDATVIPQDDAAVFPDATVADGGPDGGLPPGDGGLTFSAFVHDLISSQTSSTASPVDLPNPDLPDNEDPTAYDDLF
jgi:hypothetical protein